MIRFCLLLLIATAALTLAPSDSEACGTFGFTDLRSDRGVSFHHHATYVESKPKGRKVLVWIYADSKRAGVFGIADTTREFNSTAERRKQYWFEGDKLLYKGKEIGTWSPTSLRLGSELFEFSAAVKERGPAMWMWTGDVTLGGKTISASFEVFDNCSGDGWRRKTQEEQLEVVWKRISIYLAAEIGQRARAKKK